MYAEIGALLLYLSLAAWAQFVVRPQPPGWPRVIGWVPFAIFSYSAPAALVHANSLLMASFAGVFSLGAFKLLAFCFNRGPLTLPLSPVSFGVVVILPLVPTEAFYFSGGKQRPLPPQALRGPLQMLWDAVTTFASCLGVCVILLAFPGLFWPVRYWLLALGFCLYLQFLWDIINATVTFFCPIPVPLGFNKPWLSESIEDFWARRWNLVTTYTFRTLIYEPIMQGTLLQVDNGVKDGVGQAQLHRVSNEPLSPDSVHKPEATKSGAPEGTWNVHAKSSEGEQPREHKQTQEWWKSTQVRRFLAIQATFFVSGVWHILIFWYNTQVISFSWPVFFIVQGPIMFVERGITHRFALRARLPRLLRIAITTVILLLIGGPTFVRPAEEAGYVAQHLLSAQSALRIIVSKICIPQGMMPWIIERALQQQVLL